MAHGRALTVNGRPLSSCPRRCPRCRKTNNGAPSKNLSRHQQTRRVTPDIFYSDKPAEVILFDGQPVYAQIPNTQLEYATNTNSVVFVYKPTQQFYYLTAGRWFSAADLQGPWTYATPKLPPDFAKIPVSSPASAILATVPGTDEAKDAVLLAQVPTTMTVKPTEAAAKVKVAYAGDPKFEPIKGTSMQYGTNTADKVIELEGTYYLCLQGVWFMAPTPTGPWSTCMSVPKEIYTIPSSSPVYNVTYVTQAANPDGTVTSNYTAGYLGTFILGAATGAILADGSGYWWPPYCNAGYYYPYPATYCGAYWGYGYHNPAPYYDYNTGAYGWHGSAYGPYGSANWGAGYNPYTGMYARGGTVSTPYGSRSAAQAYNPYTGTYAQTRQGSSPNAQWGSSYVSRGNQSATMGHYSTANGTVAGAADSQGGKVAASSTKWGNSAVGKTASGNMYAGHDGNVYKNTGNGWQKYDNGSWNSVNKPQPNWQGAENNQQRTGSESYQQRTSSENSSSNRSSEASSYNRSGETGSERSSGGLTDLVVGVGPRTWIARLRTGHVAIFPVSVSKTSNAAVVADNFGGNRFGGGGGLVAVIALAVVAVRRRWPLWRIRRWGRSGADANNLGLELTSNFSYNQNSTNPTKGKHMKKLLTLTGIGSIGAVLALLAACQTTGTGDVMAQKEALLTQSGFKVITVTAPAQQQAVSRLTVGRVTAVTYNKKTYYVFPTATKDRIYVGKQAQFNAYKHALATAYASHPAAQTAAAQGQAQMAGQSLMPTLETAGQHNIEIQQFGGFGPMGVNALGDW